MFFETQPFLLSITTQPTAPLVNHAAKLFVRELNSIPNQERNQLMDRIHGVEEIVCETEDFVTTKLKELEQELKLITVKNAYNIALVQDRKYVQSRKFCLQFLRAECFDTGNAAARIVHHLEEKLRRFGKRALTRPLILADIKGNARKILVRKGSFQILSSRDRRGRAGDVAFYLMSAVAEDEETQKKGALTITIVGDIASTTDAAKFQECIDKGGLWHPGTCPIRINANHIWLGKEHCSTASMSVLNILTLRLGTEFRLLSKIHSASFTVAKNDMKTYGIPVEQLPLSLDGSELRTASHQKWIQRRSTKESRMLRDPNFRGIDLPSCEDVCLLRGTSFHLHPGNLFMKAQMEPLIAEYRTSDSGRRRKLNDLVVQAVRTTGGKFLSRADEGWFLEILEDVEVNKSVGASFRSLLARTKKKNRNSKHHIIASSGNGSTTTNTFDTDTSITNSVMRSVPEPESASPSASGSGSTISRKQENVLSMFLDSASKRAKLEHYCDESPPSIAQLSSDSAPSSNPDDSDSPTKNVIVEL